MRLALIAAVVLLAVPAAAEEPETYAFQFTAGSTTCTVSYPRADGTTLKWVIRPSDNAFNAKVVRPRWEMVDGQNTDAENMPVTVRFRDGAIDVGSSTAAYGGYDNGYNQGVWSSWNAGAAGPGSTEEAMELLQKATAVTVVFRGAPLASFDMKQRGFAYTLLKSCQPTG